MRTKALILTVALSAAGIASSLAQVYSVNAVGYVNQTIPNNFSMVANPFVNQTNTLNALLNPATLPNTQGTPGYGVSVYKFVNGNFDISAIDFFDGQWHGTVGGVDALVGDTATIDFGDGVFILNQTGAPFTLTWVGEVAQGTPLTNPLPMGFSVKSSKVPQAGGIQSALNFIPAAGNYVYKFDSSPAVQNFDIYQSDPFGGGTAAEWQQASTGLNVEPTLAIGESAFLLLTEPTSPTSWNRNFTVN